MIAHWFSINAPHCHDWIKAVPMTQSLTLSDADYEFAVRMRLNLPPDDFILDSTTCSCNFTLSLDPYHSLSCSKISKIERHNHVRDLFLQCAERINVTCSKEPSGWCLFDDRRPDLLFHFIHMQTLADVTIIHPTAKSNLLNAKFKGRICKEAEHFKMEKYKTLTIDKPTVDFVPLVFTTAGEWGQQATEFINKLAVLSTDDDCPYDPQNTSHELTHGIAVAIQRGNARMYRENLMNSTLQCN